MKTIKQLLQDGGTFTLSPENEIKYNAVVCDPNLIKKDGGSVIYSVYKIDERTNTAWAYNRNAWGQDKIYILNTNDIAPY